MVTFRHSTFSFSLISVLAASGKLPAGGWQVIPLYILEVVPIYTLTPRFIMGLRKVYARDVQGRRGSRIDTAFGLSSSDRGVDGTTVVFADIERNGGLVGVEENQEIPMTTRTTQPEQADIGERPVPCATMIPPHSGQLGLDY